MASKLMSGLFVIAVAVGTFFGLKMMENPFADEPTDSLVELVRAGDSVNRLEAIEELGRRNEDIDLSFELLATLAGCNNEKVQQAAIDALNELGDPAVELIKPLLDASDASKCKLGCAAIRSIGEPGKEFLPEVKEFLESKDDTIRNCGLYAMQGLGPHGAENIDEVIACMEDDAHFNNQCMACRVIAEMGPKGKKAESCLIRLLEEGGPSIRSWAAIGLGSIGSLESDNKKKAVGLIEQYQQGGRRAPHPTELERYAEALSMLK